MLREIRNPRQIPNERPRRWYADESMDLVVWLDDDGAVGGFQLTYDNAGVECALTWAPRSGFRHDSVDDGEGRPGRYKAAPILVPYGDFDAQGVAERFKQRAAGIDPGVSGFVYAKLRSALL